MAGASFGWFSWLQAVTVAPIEVSAVVSYASSYIPFAKTWINAQGVLSPVGITVAIVLMFIFMVINFLSVRALANTNSVATWWKIGVPVFAILILSIFSFHGSNFGAANGFAPEGAKGILAAIPNAGIVFALLGFEQADQLAGESSNPKRDIPRAVIGSVIIGLVIYLALQIVFIGTIPHDKLLSTWAATGQQFITGPFALVAIAAGLGWLAVILYIDAIISPAGTGLIYFTATSRVSYGMSRHGYLPRIFERTTSRGVPWFGLIVAWVIGCICFLPFPSWQDLVNIITSASVLMYAGAPLALGALRRRLPDADRPYRLPIAMVLSPIAFIVANLIILWTGWDYDWKLGVCIVIGYVVIILTRVLKLNTTPVHFDWKAAQWLFPYLIGMGLIVFLSDWGPLKTPIFGFGWDILVVAIFSLIIYFWAIAVPLSSQEITQIVEESSLHEEDADLTAANLEG